MLRVCMAHVQRASPLLCAAGAAASMQTQVVARPSQQQAMQQQQQPQYVDQAAARQALVASLPTPVPLDASVVRPRGALAEHAPLLVLHGLFGSKSNWRSISTLIADATLRDVHLIDLRNHGSSPHTREMSLLAMASDVAAYISSAGLESVAVLGHSMGGKVAMLHALLYPQTTERLVAVDVAPIDYSKNSGFRFFHDVINTCLAVDLSAVRLRRDVLAQLADVVPDVSTRTFIGKNVFPVPQTAPVQWRWRLNLPVLRDTIADIGAWPQAVRDAHVSWHGPVMVLRGSKSSYVTDSAWAETVRLFPEAFRETVQGSGHWVHADNPTESLRRLTPFLRPV